MKNTRFRRSRALRHGVVWLLVIILSTSLGQENGPGKLRTMGLSHIALLLGVQVVAIYVHFWLLTHLERFSGQFTVFWVSSWHESVFVGFTGAGRNGLWSARPLRGPRCGSVPRLGFLGGEAVAPPPHERFAGGSRAALPLRGGSAPCPDAFARAGLAACQRPQPGATLEELRAWMAAPGGPAVSQATLGRAVQALDGRRKKRVSTRPGATPAA